MTFDDELMAKLKADEPNKREFGVCVKFKNEAGYCFLELDDDSRTHLFVHVRDCEHEVPLAVGDRVSFVRKIHSDGRVRARKVRVEE
jgi:cold shock CspA family protein